MKSCVLILDVVYLALGIWFCDIDSNVTYPWIAGIWHGFFFPLRWVISWFSDDYLYHAVHCTSGYNVMFVIFAILSFVFYGILRLLALSLQDDKQGSKGADNQSKKSTENQGDKVSN